MDEILEQATKLGEQLAKDPRAAAMAAAKKGIEESIEDAQLLADYEDHQRKLHELESTGKPIEAADKRRMVELHEKVIASEKIKSLMKAQADYVELMSAVWRTVEEKATT